LSGNWRDNFIGMPSSISSLYHGRDYSNWSFPAIGGIAVVLQPLPFPNVEQAMLSANAPFMPAAQTFSPPPKPGLAARAVDLIRRVLRCGPRRVPDLPDDLLADVGMEISRPERADAFWEERRRSTARDLPL
jgi:hypothetical protein